MKLNPWRTTREGAASLLPEYTTAFFRAGRKALAKGDLETLHEFRIAAKKFRYVLEMFAPLYGPAFTARVQELKRLQDVLGELNDLATARTLVEGHPQAGPALTAMADRETALRSKLDRLWTTEINPDGREQSWIRYFRRIQPRVRKSPVPQRVS